MRIASEHLHRFMAGDRRDFLIAESCLDQTGNRLMAQIMEPKICNVGSLESLAPNSVDDVGPSFLIPAGLAEEDKLGI